MKVRVVDVAGDGTGPWKLFVGDFGVACWPSEPAHEDPKAYAEEVARCIRLALDSSPSVSTATVGVGSWNHVDSVKEAANSTSAIRTASDIRAGAPGVAGREAPKRESASPQPYDGTPRPTPTGWTTTDPDGPRPSEAEPDWVADAGAYQQRTTNPRAPTPERLRGIIAFARETWRDDGAEGEAVHRLCDALESRPDHPKPVGEGRPYAEQSEEWRAGYDEAEQTYHAKQREMRAELRRLRGQRTETAEKPDWIEYTCRCCNSHPQQRGWKFCPFCGTGIPSEVRQ